MKSDHASNLLAPMNPLQRSLIEKAGHDNGFEYVLPSETQHAVLASARHPARVRVTVVGQAFEARIDSGSTTLAQELERTFAIRLPNSAVFVLPTEALLAQWLRREGVADTDYTVRQGTVLGRGGYLLITYEADAIWVGGATRTVITGNATLDETAIE